MKRLHVLVVTRRYWPHCDDACHRLSGLVEGLHRQGAVITVLSPRYESRWPTQLYHREINIVRPLVAPRGDWSMARYIRNLGKWLNEHLRRFDVVYCDAMREDAAAAIEKARQFAVPSVVRCGALLGESDILWHVASRGRRAAFTKCTAADAIVAPRASSQQALLAASASADKIVRISDGIGPPLRISPSVRKAARESLAHINSDLRVPQNGRVILCMNRMSAAGGVHSLACAMSPLLERSPDDRLWLIGDGPWRSKIYSELKHGGMGRCAFMPGSFDHLEELMHAADVFVLPSTCGGIESFWPAAIAAAVPCAVVDCADTRWFAGAAFGMLHSFRSDSAQHITAAVEHLLANLDSAGQAARQIRKQLSAAMPASQTIERHMQLFQRLTSSQAGSGSENRTSGATR